MMAPTKKKLRVRKKEKGSAKLSQQPPPRHETSPDSKCPICLDRFVNVASVGRCLHRFCFHCIREWAKNKAECPLCKQPFRSIFHSVKAENDFKEYVVLENAPSASTSESAAVTPTAAATSGQNNAESAATQTQRSRATRSGQRRSPRNQEPNPSASSTERVSQLLDALFQQGPAFLQNLLSGLSRFHQQRIVETGDVRPQTQSQSDPILHEMFRFTRAVGPMQCPPALSHEEDRGSPSSIINISEDDGDGVQADVTKDNTQEGVPLVPVATNSEISLSQSAWDDETPGPSYSTLGHPQTENVESEENRLGGTSVTPKQREHEEDENDEEDECMIVGYVKPMAERTPELVQLSSDSTEEEEAEGGGNQAAATETPMKAETSLPSHEHAPLSPMSYPSTSHTERGENPEQSTQRDSGKLSHQRRKEHALRRGFRRSLHLLSASHSQTSSESSPQSERSVKINRSHVRLGGRELRRRSHHALGRRPTGLAERDDDTSEELLPARSVSARDKLSKPFSPWDSPGHDSERKRRRRKRRREREPERSRSPQRELRNRHGDRELWLDSSSSSSDTESRREKPAGKRKYKTRHLERTALRRSSGKSREKEWERERSPSVEIVFERRAADTHSRSKRHKKRSRRRERAQNSPTIITIESDSDHTNHTEANGQMEVNGQTEANCQTEANSHAADFQNRLTDDDLDDMDNVHTADTQNHTADYNEHVTDFSDHTVDYQEHLA